MLSDRHVDEICLFTALSDLGLNENIRWTKDTMCVLKECLSLLKYKNICQNTGH